MHHRYQLFHVGKLAKQGHPKSEYHFILVLETVFIMIKSNQNIQPIKVFDNDFLYTAYADSTTFFLTKNNDSVTEALYTSSLPHLDGNQMNQNPHFLSRNLQKVEQILINFC